MWNQHEEAERLKKRFSEINRAQFARDFSVPGGEAMIYQHITGRKPISLEAAKSYARGFNCSLAEISQRLAKSIEGLSNDHNVSNANRDSAVTKLPSRIDPTIAEVIRVMEATDDTGRKLALAGVKVALSGYEPASKRKQES